MARTRLKLATPLPIGVLVGVGVVALCAAALSFDSLDALGQRIGWDAVLIKDLPVISDFKLSMLLPLTIDAQAAVATYAWIHPSISERGQQHAKWIAIGSLAVSIAGNAAEHVMAAYDVRISWWAIALVGAIPAVSLFATVHLCSLLVSDFQVARAQAQKQHATETSVVEQALTRPEPRKPRRERATGSADARATGSAAPEPVEQPRDVEPATDTPDDDTATGEPDSDTDTGSDTSATSGGENATTAVENAIASAVAAGTLWRELNAADIARAVRDRGIKCSDPLARRIVAARRVDEMRRYVAAALAQGRQLGDLHPQELTDHAGGKSLDAASGVLDELRAAAARAATAN